MAPEQIEWPIVGGPSCGHLFAGRRAVRAPDRRAAARPVCAAFAARIVDAGSTKSYCARSNTIRPPLPARQRAEDGCDLRIFRAGCPEARGAFDGRAVHDNNVLCSEFTPRGLLELYDDPVSFDFEVVSYARTLRSVHIPLNRVRSVEYRSSWESVEMQVEHGPWTVQLPSAKGTKVSGRIGSKEEGEDLVAAMRERLESRPSDPSFGGTTTSRPRRRLISFPVPSQGTRAPRRVAVRATSRPQSIATLVERRPPKRFCRNGSGPAHSSPRQTDEPDRPRVRQH